MFDVPEDSLVAPLDAVTFDSKTVEVLDQAVARFANVLACAGFDPSATVLNAFGPAYGALDAMAQCALGSRAMSAQALLADDAVVATCFVGAPDRFYALCMSGYGKVLTHAVLAGGAVFPAVREAAEAQNILLCDVMSDHDIGPYAFRGADQDAYTVLEGLKVQLVQPGTEISVAPGLVGEVVIEGEVRVRTGTLSALEQVPHKYRAPGLRGWLGFVQDAVTIGEDRVALSDMAALVDAHDDVLAVRLCVAPTYETASDDNGPEHDPAVHTVEGQGSKTPVLQVETEAGDWIDNLVEAQFTALTGMLAKVERVAPGQLPNTGRVFARQAS